MKTNRFFGSRIARFSSRYHYPAALTTRTFEKSAFVRYNSSGAGGGNNVTNDDGTGTSITDVVQGPSLLRTPVARPSPSLLFLPGLRSLPFWTSAEDRSGAGAGGGGGKKIAYGDPTVNYVVNYLEANVDTIRQEYLQIAPTLQSDYASTGHDTLHEGSWDWHSYLSKGSVQGHFAFNFPQTAKILNDGLRGPDNGHLLFEGTPFGFAFFSTLHGQSKIAAHTAPMNFRLRIHLPLIVPERNTTSVDEHNDDDDNLPPCGIRVGPIVRPWVRDSALVLDDSYDHEVWNNTDDKRVLLLVDIWHPDVTLAEKEAIVQMFEKAKSDGLWKR